ncbi:MAG: NAD-dependent epimerase/dehydratase family protein, partial [Paracoccaceae bacterium]
MANLGASPETTKTVLVLGAYGLVGSGIARRLARDGHNIIGFGRDIDIGRRVLPNIDWVTGDLQFLTDDAAWAPFLSDIDVVVNCSGALQDGPADDLEAVHHHAIAALAQACALADVKIIQISATGAQLDASTSFLASKARGDAAIQQSGARHVIFRPGLVLAQNSYGGSTLLRMLAAIPIVQPIALPDAKIQTVGLDDVAEAVSAAVTDKIPDGFVG